MKIKSFKTHSTVSWNLLPLQFTRAHKKGDMESAASRHLKKWAVLCSGSISRSLAIPALLFIIIYTSRFIFARRSPWRIMFSFMDLITLPTSHVRSRSDVLWLWLDVHILCEYCRLLRMIKIPSLTSLLDDVRKEEGKKRLQDKIFRAWWCEYINVCLYAHLYVCTFYFSFLSRVITLLCYPCFRDLCRGNNIVRILGKAKNSFSTEPIALAKLFPCSWLVWHITKEHFLTSHKFPSKIIWLYNTVVKLKRTETFARARNFLSETKHFQSCFHWSWREVKTFHFFLSSLGSSLTLSPWLVL